MQQQWAIEGELLDVQMKIDKLKKKSSLTEEEKASLEDMTKRKDVLEKQLRKERMKSC